MSCFWQVCRGQLLATPAYSLHFGQLQKPSAECEVSPLTKSKKKINNNIFLSRPIPSPSPRPTLAACPCSRSRRPSAAGGCSRQRRWSCRRAAWGPAGWSRGPGPAHTWWCGRCWAGERSPLSCRSCRRLPCWTSGCGSPSVSLPKALGCSHIPAPQTLRKGEKNSGDEHLIIPRGLKGEQIHVLLAWLADTRTRQLSARSRAYADVGGQRERAPAMEGSRLWAWGKYQQLWAGKHWQQPLLWAQQGGGQI